MKRTRRKFLADLLFLGSGLTASALLVGSGGQGCGQTITSDHVTQGVLTLSGATERLEALKARHDKLDPLTPGTPDTALWSDVNCSPQDLEHPAGLGPGYGPRANDREIDPPLNFDKLEPLVFVRLRW